MKMMSSRKTVPSTTPRMSARGSDDEEVEGGEEDGGSVRVDAK